MKTARSSCFYMAILFRRYGFLFRKRYLQGFLLFFFFFFLSESADELWVNGQRNDVDEEGSHQGCPVCAEQRRENCRAEERAAFIVDRDTDCGQKRKPLRAKRNFVMNVVPLKIASKQ